MPATRLQEKARLKYVTVKEFQNQYSMSRAQTYRILALPQMKEAIIKVGEKAIRINLDKAFQIMQQLFS